MNWKYNRKWGGTLNLWQIILPVLLYIKCQRKQKKMIQIKNQPAVALHQRINILVECLRAQLIIIYGGKPVWRKGLLRCTQSQAPPSSINWQIFATANSTLMT